MSNSDKTDYKNKLTKIQYHITREGGTETPFSGEFCNFFESGKYICICCGNPLFDSNSKFKSGSGWPDFNEIISEGAIIYDEDFSGGNKQIEVKCSKCDAHLGHMFDDGPAPTYRRY